MRDSAKTAPGRDSAQTALARVALLGLMGDADLFCGRSDFIMERVAMFRLASRVLVLSAVAGLAAFCAPRAAVPRASASSTAKADDTKQVVIRFVQNPEAAPPLQAQDLFGRPVNKDNWAGKVVLVNFWATWCPPCRMEIPELLELKKEYGDRLEIVGISEDDDGPETVVKFVRQKGMTYPVVMATKELVASYGGVPALPTTFVVNTEGRVVTKHSGLYPKETYDQEIRSLLGMPVEARVETFVDTGQLFLRNAANATELPGVSFKGLTAEQKKRALRRLNEEGCTCGCDLTLSQCRVNDTGCPVSGDLAAQIVKDAAKGTRPTQPPPAKGTKGASSISQ
jgi:thiol-disulfide isomerase/thioredoxin